jgi:AcrR family transcriptional regulator
MTRTNRRTPLSRQAVLEAAVSVADESGVAAVSMRRIAEKLGVEAMSLYHHVQNKEDVLDALVDLVFAEIELPPAGTGWRTAMRDRAASARQVLARHVWAVSMMDSRARPGPATLRHHDTVLGSLRNDGFSLVAAAHAVSVLDSYVYGFVMQEHALPFDVPAGAGASVQDIAGDILKQLPTEEFPHLTEMIVHHALQPGYSYADEFDIGLNLILDGLDGLRHQT